MISIKTIYQLSFYIVLSLTFLVGGFFQYFLGVSNTGLTMLLGIFMFLNYVIYVFIKQKVFINGIFLFFSLYVCIIFLSAFVNGSDLINTVIYLFFPFLPLSVYYFFYINRKEGYVARKPFYQFIFFIGLIQLPILLIQRNFYDFLVIFNNSGQYVASYDFLFGSFLMKSDHSLGCYLLFLIMALLFNIREIRCHFKNWLIIALYLSLSILLAESNISKAFLITTWFAYLFKVVYQKIPRSLFNAKFYILISVILISVLAYNIRNTELITTRLGGTIEQNFTLDKSEKFYEEGTAKRSQIVIVAFYKLKTKFLGEGPYHYFDIRTGEFKKTHHFSQLIWTYFDLGLFGLIIVFFYIFFLIKTALKSNKSLFIFILPLALVYMMYTNVFFEIGILISLFLIFSVKQNNESSSSTISRLEKK